MTRRSSRRSRHSQRPGMRVHVQVGRPVGAVAGAEGERELNDLPLPHERILVDVVLARDLQDLNDRRTVVTGTHGAGDVVVAEVHALTVDAAAHLGPG